MRLEFQHINLERSDAVYNGMTISVRQNDEKFWRIFVNGRVTNKGPFLARKFAIECLEKMIAKIEGTAPPVFSEVKSLGEASKPKRRVCPHCGATRFPHRCAGPKPEFKPKLDAPIRRIR